MRDSDTEWETFGRDEPYYGVLSDDRFRKERLDADTVAEFFESGRQDIEFVLETIRTSVMPEFAPSRTLDFGCGVGRCAIPLARVCQSVVGADVSDSMLQEARRTCRDQSISNLELVKSDDTLAGIRGPFDFVHSFLVFQHIAPTRGERIFARLIDLLANGGLASVQFVYLRDELAAIRALGKLRRFVPLVHMLANLAYHKPFREPLMEKNVYDLNRLLAILHSRGCGSAHVRFLGTGKLRSVILFFRKTPDRVPYDTRGYDY